MTKISPLLWVWSIVVLGWGLAKWEFFGNFLGKWLAESPLVFIWSYHHSSTWLWGPGPGATTERSNDVERLSHQQQAGLYCHFYYCYYYFHIYCYYYYDFNTDMSNNFLSYFLFLLLLLIFFFLHFSLTSLLFGIQNLGHLHARVPWVANLFAREEVTVLLCCPPPTHL